MSTPLKAEIQGIVIDSVGLAVADAAMLRLTRRLREGRTKPRRRWVGRASGAVLSELVAVDPAEESWQRLRRVTIVDGVGLAVADAALLRLTRRLREGRTKPRRRWVSRAAVAVLSELVAQGAAEASWQRLRMRAAVDQRLAAASVATPPAGLAHIPRQRVPERLHAESAGSTQGDRARTGPALPGGGAVVASSAID